MVWGMDRPTGLGEYFPDGQFESGRWNGRMMGHFHKQSPDVQKALFDTPLEPLDAMQFYAGFVVDKFRCEWGVRTSPRPEHPPLTPVLDHELPTSFDTVKSYQTLASFISLNDRIAAVDAEFMELLEKVEPGVHRFYPIEIMMPKNQVFPNSGGKLNIKSGPKNRIPDLAFAQGIHGGAHLWRERRFGERLTCLSDVLVAEIQKAGLRTPKMFKMIAG